MSLDPAALDALRERVIGCCIAVHRALGPGLLESIYRDCLMIELKAAGLRVEREHSVTLHYRGEPVGTALRLDLLVEGMLVVEVIGLRSKIPPDLLPLLSKPLAGGCRATSAPDLQATRRCEEIGLKSTIPPDLLALLSKLLASVRPPKRPPLDTSLTRCKHRGPWRDERAYFPGCRRRRR